MISNNVKTKWAKKETVLNSFLSIANPFTAEIMSEQGYDALTIDHQPVSYTHLTLPTNREV